VRGTGEQGREKKVKPNCLRKKKPAETSGTRRRRNEKEHTRGRGKRGRWKFSEGKNRDSKIRKERKKIQTTLGGSGREPGDNLARAGVGGSIPREVAR